MLLLVAGFLKLREQDLQDDSCGESRIATSSLWPSGIGSRLRRNRL